MKTEIQNNIVDTDFAYHIGLRIEFNNLVSESIIDEIDNEISESLLKLGIGFGSAHGVDFIDASLLDFGNSTSFKEAKISVNESIKKHQKYIELVKFRKSEFLISETNFIGEQLFDFEETTLNLKKIYPDLIFTEIEYHNDSPERQSISAIANDSSLSIWMSNFDFNNKSLIRTSIGSKSLTENQLNDINKKLDNIICTNINQVNWNGLDWNSNKEIWELPKDGNLYKKIE